MPDFIIRNLPDELHRRLKEQAANHQRSMNKELLAILEVALKGPTVIREPAVEYGELEPNPSSRAAASNAVDPPSATSATAPAWREPGLRLQIDGAELAAAIIDERDAGR